MRSPIPPGGGIFAKMDFPDFVYKEYPKIVDAPDGRRVTVNNQREELELASQAGIGLAPSPAEAERDKLALALAEKEQELEKLRAQLSQAAGAPALTQTEIARGQATVSGMLEELTGAKVETSGTQSKIVKK